MRILRIAGVASLLLFGAATSSESPPAESRLSRRDYEQHDYVAVHLDPSVSPDRIAKLLGARHEGQIGELEDHHTFSFPKGYGADIDQLLDDLKTRRQRRRRGVDQGDAPVYLSKRGAVDFGGMDGILWSEKMELKQRLQKRIPPPPLEPKTVKRSSKVKDSRKTDFSAIKKQQAIAAELQIQDPIFMSQWHLYNPIDIGNDINVTGVWLEGITGNGSISTIIDDGLDMYSNDLKDNYYAEGSYDYNDKTKEPKPRLSADKHGTRCAGEVAAGKNDICGVGVAYDSKVAAIRILSKPISDVDEAEAINYGYQQSQIYSCSWGPPDNGATMDAPSLLIRKAMVNGIQKGRNGKGSLFVFAAGNGAASGDNCNFDGYTNSIYSITVGSIDDQNEHAYYSESCSAQLVVTYSSGGTQSILTTDVGLDACTSTHGGTSAAGPLVVGVLALALSVRPDLTWRDAQYIMVESAVPIHLDKDGWQKNGAGKYFSHDFGFGKVDAYAAVQKAKEWKLVKPQAWFHSPWLKVHRDIPQGSRGLVSTFEVTEDMLKKSNLGRLEHVTVTMNVNHTRRGDLSAELRSPSGVISYLSTARTHDLASQGYVDWTFMSVAHW